MIGGLNALASAKMVIVAMAKPKRFIQTADRIVVLKDFIFLRIIGNRHFSGEFIRATDESISVRF